MVLHAFSPTPDKPFVASPRRRCCGGGPFQPPLVTRLLSKTPIEGQSISALLKGYLSRHSKTRYMSAEVSLTDLFEFEVTEGVMKNRLTNGRAFMFGSSAWSTMREDLKGVYGPLGTAITEEMGRSYGRSLGKIGKKLHMDLQAFFEAMVKLGSKTGWGRLSLSGGNPLAGHARLMLESCVFCTDRVGHEDRSCEFFSGVIRGAAEEITGKEHRVVETECVSAGFDYCEFFLQKLEKQASY
jgi:predicted hydrocarbon binding protein